MLAVVYEYEVGRQESFERFMPEHYRCDENVGFRMTKRAYGVP